MKNSIIYLGIAIVLCITSNGTNTINKNESLHQEQTLKVSKTEKVPKSKNKLIICKSKNFPSVEEISVFYPETVLGSYQQKTVQEIIIENNKIIDSNATSKVSPLELDTLIIDQIAQDNAIIDSKIANDFLLLDFKIINSI